MTKRILLDEIDVLIVESTAVALTTSLLSELIKHKIAVLFCDEKHNPISELMPLSISYNSSKKISEQIAWDRTNLDIIWKRIVEEKIINQSKTLLKVGKLVPAMQLKEYANNVESGDATNREGHAAKVYFNNMFYDNFTRNDDTLVNACLNYGYTLILSLFNRTITSFGYLTQIGIHHKGETNPYNLSSDLMEPFRFLVDEEVLTINFTKEVFKDKMIELLNKSIMIDGKKQTLTNAISLYFLSVVDAIKNGSPNRIKFISVIKDENE